MRKTENLTTSQKTDILLNDANTFDLSFMKMDQVEEILKELV